MMKWRDLYCKLLEASLEKKVNIKVDSKVEDILMGLSIAGGKKRDFTNELSRK